MKSTILKAVAKITEKAVQASNHTTCLGWSYQPKLPANIKDFKK